MSSSNFRAGFLPRVVLECHGTGALSLALILAWMFAASALPLASIEAVAAVLSGRGAGALPGALVHVGLALILALIESPAHVWVADQQQIFIVGFEGF